MSGSRVPPDEVPKYYVEEDGIHTVIHDRDSQKFITLKGADNETVYAVVECINALEASHE